MFSLRIKRSRKRGIVAAYQCPISGRKWEYHSLEQKRAAREAQRLYTSDLIDELDGDSYGIIRPLQFYIDKYRRHGLRARPPAN